MAVVRAWKVAPPDDVRRLREAIAVSMKKAVFWRDQFKNAPAPGDAAKLLALIKERSKTWTHFVQDAVADTAAWRLARLQKPTIAHGSDKDDRGFSAEPFRRDRRLEHACRP